MKSSKLQAELKRYSKQNGYEATQFDSIVCQCKCIEFKLFSDDEEGGCSAECVNCGQQISVLNSADYMAEVVQNTCSCEHENLQLMTGIALYEGTQDPRWVYVGACCPKCYLAGVYVDWSER